MDQKDKELLLKDLCARLPYEVIVKDRNGTHKLTAGNTEFTDLLYNGKCNIRPYLFPFSSMTEEQKREYNSLRHFVPTYHYEYGDIVEDTELYDSFESIDYLIANHFDYRGLIPMGLAIDATGLNIY